MRLPRRRRIPKKIAPKLPTKAFIRELLLRTGAARDKNLMAHINAVSRVATNVARTAESRGWKVNVTLVERSAMLHDAVMTGRDTERANLANVSEIDKKISQRSGEKMRMGFRHDRAASDLLKRKGFAEVARIVGRHGDRAPEAAEKFFSIEERILDLVDSRTRGDRFVSLDEKLVFLLERYGNKENCPPQYKSPEEYRDFITRKFESLKLFEARLKRSGLDIDTILK